MSYNGPDPFPVHTGGTGANTLTGVLTGNGTSAITGHAVTEHSLLLAGASNVVDSLGVATNGQIPIGSTGADPVLATLTSSGSTITITNGAGSINLEVAGGGGGASLSPYIVGATLSDFTTIQAAINQAVTDGASITNPKNIYIKPGTYAENLTAADGINLIGLNPDAVTVFVIPPYQANPAVIVTGIHTFPSPAMSAPGVMNCYNISFNPTPTSGTTWTLQATTQIYFEGCFITVSTNSDYVFDITDAGVFAKLCQIVDLSPSSQGNLLNLETEVSTGSIFVIESTKCPINRTITLIANTSISMYINNSEFDCPIDASAGTNTIVFQANDSQLLWTNSPSAVTEVFNISASTDGQILLNNCNITSNNGSFTNLIVNNNATFPVAINNCSASQPGQANFLSTMGTPTQMANTSGNGNVFFENTGDFVSFYQLKNNVSTANSGVGWILTTTGSVGSSIFQFSSTYNVDPNLTGKLAITGAVAQNIPIGNNSQIYYAGALVRQTNSIDFTYVTEDLKTTTGYTGSDTIRSQATIQTTDNTPTVLASVLVNMNESIVFKGMVVCSNSSHSTSTGGDFTIVARRSTGNVLQVGTEVVNVQSDDAATFDAIVDTGTQTVQLLVTGTNGVTRNWVCTYEYQKVLTDA